MLHVLLVGFLLGITQIGAIGLQNSFVLNHGIRGKPIFLICLACSLCDIIMISCGIFGVGSLFFTNPEYIKLFQSLGGAFLLFYGAKLLRNSFTKNNVMDLKQEHKNGSIILTIIAVGILNPQSWIDCIIVIGSVSTKYIGIDKVFFAIGCIMASVIWFFALGYFSKKIAYLFYKPITWKILDFIMAFIMFSLAYNLLR